MFATKKFGLCSGSDCVPVQRQSELFTGGWSTQVVWMFSASRCFSSCVRRSADISKLNVFLNKLGGTEEEDTAAATGRGEEEGEEEEAGSDTMLPPAGRK